MFVRRLIGGLGIGLALLITGACTGGTDDDRVSELEAEVASLEEQLAAAQAQLGGAGDSTSPPQGAPTVAPTTGDATVTMTEFGFTLAVPSGLEVASAGIEGDAEPSATAGQISAADGQVAVVLLWTSAETSAEEAVAGAFELVRAASTELDFAPTNQGPLTLVDTDGAFGAFQVERDGVEAGVGIVGGWRCESRVFSLTVLGADAAAVESAFAGLVGGFGCEA